MAIDIVRTIGAMASPQFTALGWKIVEAMADAGIEGPKELAKRSGLPGSTLTRAMYDDVTPTASTLASLAEALGVPIETFTAVIGQDNVTSLPRKRRTDVPTWEYRIALPASGRRDLVAAMERQLNDMGADGWELVGTNPAGLFIFKRAVSE